MAKELDALRELFLKQVQAEHVSGLSALLAFNAGMAASLKDVLKNRDHALSQYNKATALLDARSRECQRWQVAQANSTQREESAESSNSEGAGMMSSLLARMEKMIDDPQRGAKLQEKVSEAERAQVECKSKWESISGSVAKETQSFHAMTNADFSCGLREHVQQQITFEEEKQRMWSDLLHVFEQVPAANVD